MLDLVLAPQERANVVSSVVSHRDVAVATNHFMGTCCLEVDCTQQKPMPKTKPKDRNSLKNDLLEECFASAFAEAHLAPGSDCTHPVFGAQWSKTDKAFHEAENVLPERERVANKLWIQSGTLDLTHERQRARLSGNFREEKHSHKLVRKSARIDRTT